MLIQTKEITPLITALDSNELLRDSLGFLFVSNNAMYLLTNKRASKTTFNPQTTDYLGMKIFEILSLPQFAFVATIRNGKTRFKSFPFMLKGKIRKACKSSI